MCARALAPCSVVVRARRSVLTTPRVRNVAQRRLVRCAASSDAKDVVVVAEWLAARREADADPYVAYGNDEGFVDLGTSRSMFMIDQPNLAATCGLDASGIVGSAAAAYDLAVGTYSNLMHALVPECRDAHYVLALEDVAAHPLAAMAVDLARGRAVMVMAPHAMGVSECIHRAGVQATVVAPEHGLTACGLRDLHHHHAQAAAQGLHVGVVVAALGVEESVADLEHALHWAHSRGVELVVDVGSVDSLVVNNRLAACLQLQQGEQGGTLHITAAPGFGEREMPTTALFTSLSLRSLVRSKGAKMVPPSELPIAQDVLDRAIQQELLTVSSQSTERLEGAVYELSQLLGTPGHGVTTVCLDSQHLWLRLTPFLDVDDVESEVQMWRVLYETYKLVLLPGHLAGVPHPGWFRACVSGVDEDTLVAGLERLESYLKAQKMLHGRW